MLLLDSWERVVPLRPGVERIVRSVTPTARRFVFDTEASAHVGRLLFEAADLVCEQIVFAKPPYDHTYLELDSRAMFEAWRPTSANPVESSDDKIGLLYIKDKLYCLCSSDKPGGVGQTLGMFVTTIGHGQTTPLHKIFGHTSKHVVSDDSLAWQKYVKVAYLLGGMRQPGGGIFMPRADYDYFLDNYDLDSTLAPFDNPTPQQQQRRFDTMVDSAFLGGGDLLIGAACLLLIHGNKKGVSVQSVPHHRGWFKGKRVVYRTHGVVKIKLGQHDSMRRVVFGKRESPRRHDVMGTWAHYHREPNCDHDWVRLEDLEHERYQCTKCPTLRTWRAAHVRGDGEKGVRTKSYEITE